MEELRKRDLLVSKTWIQAVALVVVFGFFVLGLLAYRTYSGEAPIPARVVDQKGNVLFTRDDILDGQQVFLRNGLMEYGSIFGHGAYLGPDYTADYLRRSATSVYEVHGGQKSDSANSQTVAEFKTNRYDAASDTLTFTAGAVHGVCPAQGLLSVGLQRSLHAIRTPAGGHQRSPRNRSIDRVFRMVGVGGFGHSGPAPTIRIPTIGRRSRWWEIELRRTR